MANHVHALLTPRIHPTQSIASLKGATARQANKVLGRTGEPFWQEEFFDRMVRDNQEFDRVLGYIEWNPVKVELATRPEDFAWSSAAKNTRISLQGGGGEVPRVTPPMEGGLQPASSFSSTIYERLSEVEPQPNSGAEAPRGLKPALL